MQAKKTLPLPSVVLWDMDGTLIDQTVAIIRCYTDVISGMGYPAPEQETIRRSLGGPMRSTMELFISEDHLDTACRKFRAHFPSIMLEGLIIQEGAKELISFFARKHIAQTILTNKHGVTAREVSKYAGFDQSIPICVGNADTEWQKPQRELTEYTLELTSRSKQGACVIGDSPTDIETARNCNILSYCVATGAHSVKELVEAGADAAFTDLGALAKAFACSEETNFR